jgi:hypothetical protein
MSPDADMLQLAEVERLVLLAVLRLEVRRTPCRSGS